MPSIHEYAVGGASVDDLPLNLGWKVRAYKAIFFSSNAADRLLLEKLVSELEDEAAAVTIAQAPLDLSKLTTNLDVLQTTPNTDQPQD